MNARAMWLSLTDLHKTWQREAGNPVIAAPGWITGVVWGIEKAMDVVKRHMSEEDLKR
jgi:hypothetical protein